MGVQSVWWYNASAHFPAPRALIYYHIPKTGGASIVYWMLRHNPRFSLKLDYTRAHLFAQLLSGRWSGPAPAPFWQNTAVAVEYHYYTMGEYVHSMAPRIRELRAIYASANGSLTSFTTLRDPASHIKSWYMMFPPRTDHRRRLVPLHEWAESGAVGLMTRSLLANTRVFPNRTECETEYVKRASTVLASFDYVMQMTSMNRNRNRICERLGWVVCPQIPHKRETGPMRVETQKEVDNTPDHIIRSAARCDEVLTRQSASSQNYVGDVSTYTHGLVRLQGP